MSKREPRSIDEYLMASEEEGLLVVPVAQDDRPLSGSVGLLDWRIRGQISRIVAQGKLSGATGESVLMPVRTNHGLRKLLLVGMGTKTSTSRPSDFSKHIRGQIDGLGVKRVLFIDSFFNEDDEKARTAFNTKFETAFQGLETGWVR